MGLKFLVVNKFTTTIHGQDFRKYNISFHLRESLAKEVLGCISIFLILYKIAKPCLSLQNLEYGLCNSQNGRVRKKKLTTEKYSTEKLLPPHITSADSNATSYFAHL